MIKRPVTVLFVTLALAGCAFTGHKATPTQQYHLQQPPSPGGASKQTQHFPVVLRVARPKAPAWLNKRNIYYQLTYEKSSRVSAYAHSRWVEPPPAMLGQALEQTLAGTKAFKAITQSGGDVAADLVLRVQLTNFLQRFMSRKNSFGILDARATLVDVSGGKVLQQHEFRYSIAAPTADAVGGVQALSAANGKFTSAVARWVRKTLSQCEPECLKNAGK